MSEKFLSMATKIYLKFPILRPSMKFIGRIFFPIKPKFSGWGMETIHELPWNGQYGEEVFCQAMLDIKKTFEFSIETTGTDRYNIDEFLWRHWIVSYCIRYSIEFTNNNFNFVECGVGDGISSFFALREIQGHNISKFTMHLYDAWSSMKKADLLESEMSHAGKYGNLSIDITKRNLSEFSNNLVYHKGHIPDSFMESSDAPNTIIYLHIDLNSAKPTLDTLDFFFSRLIRGGIILFDDYGWAGYEDTKKIIDKFFSDKPGVLMKLPTGQAIYYR